MRVQDVCDTHGCIHTWSKTYSSRKITTAAHSRQHQVIRVLHNHIWSSQPIYTKYGPEVRSLPEDTTRRWSLVPQLLLITSLQTPLLPLSMCNTVSTDVDTFSIEEMLLVVGRSETVVGTWTPSTVQWAVVVLSALSITTRQYRVVPACGGESTSKDLGKHSIIVGGRPMHKEQKYIVIACIPNSSLLPACVTPRDTRCTRHSQRGVIGRRWWIDRVHCTTAREEVQLESMQVHSTFWAYVGSK